MTISRYQLDDRVELAAFRSRSFGPGSPQTNPERDSWLSANPDNDGTEALWLCRRHDAESGRDDLVGQHAEVPFELRVGRDERRAWWAVDMKIDSKWHLPGAGPALVDTLAEGKGVVAAVGLRDDTYAACIQAGWTDLGMIPLYVRPLSVGGARRAFRSSRGPLAAWLAGTVAAVAGLARQVTEQARRLVDRLRRVRLVGVEKLDERSDKVWSAAADSYAVLARRDRETLAWRIDQHPESATMERYYLLRRRRPVGYVVCRAAEMGGERVVVVHDYLAPPHWVAPLLAAAGREAAKDGAVALLVRTRNEPAEARLRRRGFLRTDKRNKRPARFVISCADEAGICTLVQAPEMWFVTATDGDLDHADPRATGTEAAPAVGRRAGPAPHLR